MIYRSPEKQICLQKSSFSYAFQSFYRYSSLSTELEKTGLGYVPIGPTNLVEWQDDL